MDSLLITVTAPKPVDIGKDTSICSNDSITLNAKSNYASYLWQNGSSDSFYIVKSPGKYYVTAKDNCNNISSDTVVVKNIFYPAVSIGNDTALCSNTTDTLHANMPYQKYLWQDASTDSFYVVKQPGQYYITVTDICNNVSSDTVTIKYDTNRLSAGSNLEICMLQDTLLRATGGFTDYQWQPADSIIGNSSSQSIHISPAQTTAYIVSAQSLLGCTLSDTIKVTVENCLNKLVMPNAFTPNHDGKNDIIRPVVYGYLEKYDFIIYNRWGQMVFHSAKEGEGWDGAINGIVQNVGAYVWFCRYQFSGEKEKMDKGSFVLIR